jgi:hypothetical protein
VPSIFKNVPNITGGELEYSRLITLYIKNNNTLKKVVSSFFQELKNKEKRKKKK